MDVEITELVKFEVDRIDGVESPANGFPVLMMKGLGVAKGARDCPKCSKNYDADHTGAKCENCGTSLPDAPASKAAPAKVDCPTCKGDGKIMGGKRDCPDCDASGSVTPGKAKALAAKSAPAELLAQSLAGAGDWTPGQWAEWGAVIEKAVPGVRLLPPGKAAGDTGEDRIAPEGTTVDTVTQTGDLTEVVKAAVIEAQAPLIKRIADLESAKDADRAELAKMKATPVPGGPVLSRNVQVKIPGGEVNEDLAAKAARYREKAAEQTSPADREGYLALARKTEQQAKTPS